MPTNGTIPDTPVVYPSLTTGGRTYICRPDQRAEFLLATWKTSLQEVIHNLGDVVRFYQMWAACVACNFKSPEKPPTPEEWVASMPEDPVEAHQLRMEMIKVLTAAMGKYSSDLGAAGLIPTKPKPQEVAQIQ